MASRELADILGIQHKNLLCKIDTLQRLLLPHTLGSEFATSKNQKFRCYSLDEIGLRFLLMSLNGIDDIKLNLAKGIPVLDCLKEKAKGNDTNFVYAFEADEKIKIGMTKNIAERFKTTITYSPNAVELFRIPCNTRKEASLLEKSIHNHFKDSRVGGEWFNVSKEDLINFIGVKNEISFQ